LITHRHIRKGV